MSQSVDLIDSGIVMAEQSSHDVVNQTLSGGDPSPSDVPASANDKNTAGGDVGETRYTATTMSYDPTTHAHHTYGDANMQDRNYAGKDNGASAMVSFEGVCGGLQGSPLTKTVV